MNTLTTFAQTYGTFNNFLLLATVGTVGQIVFGKMKNHLEIKTQHLSLGVFSTIQGVGIACLLSQTVTQASKPLKVAASLLGAGLVLLPSLSHKRFRESVIKKLKLNEQSVVTVLSTSILMNLGLYCFFAAKFEHPYLMAGLRKIAPDAANAAINAVYFQTILAGGAAIVNGFALLKILD